MSEQIGVVVISEKSNGKSLKVSYKTIRREELERQLNYFAGGKMELRRVAKKVANEVILVVLHHDYRTISIITNTDNLEAVQYKNVDMFYVILDAVSTHVTSDNVISKYAWDSELLASDKIKTKKIDKNNLGLFSCKLDGQYVKKELLEGDILEYDELRKRICRAEGPIPSTLLILLSETEFIQKILLWDNERIIGVIHEDGTRYALEISEKTYDCIKKQLVSSL